MRRFFFCTMFLTACSSGAPGGEDAGAPEAAGQRYIDVAREQPCGLDSEHPCDAGVDVQDAAPCVPSCADGIAQSCELGVIRHHVCDGLYACKCGSANGPGDNDPGAWCNCVRHDCDGGNDRRGCDDMESAADAAPVGRDLEGPRPRHLLTKP